MQYKHLVIKLLILLIFQTSIAVGNGKYDELREVSNLYPDSAIRILNKLIRESESIEDSETGYYYSLKGRILLDEERFTESLENLIKADKIANNSSDYNLKVNVTESFTMFYIKQMNFNAAKKYIDQLLSFEKNIEDKNLLIKINNTVGNYYSDFAYFYENDGNSFIDTAIIYFKKALEYSKKINNPGFLSSNYISLGICYYDKGEYNKSIKYYNKALEQTKLSNDSIALADVLTNLGSVYFDKGQYKKALDNYKKAGEIFRKHDYGKGIYLSEFLLADTYKAMDDYKNAYEHEIKGRQLYDSIYILEKEKIINDLLVKYETRKKEDKIKAQKAKLEMAAIRARNKNLAIISLAFLIVFIVTIAVFISKSARMKTQLIAKEVEIKSQEINKLLKEQELKSYSAMLEGQDKERQRIASDLHDRLGGILSTVKAYFQTIDEKIKSLEEKTVVQYEKAAELLNTAVEEVRNISHDLHSGVLKNFGLCAAVSDLKNTIELTGQLKIDLFVSGKKRKLDTNKEIEIYRLVQELFSNTMKHARANKVTLQFTFAENNINVIFEDDGIGFDPRKVTKGIGLKNIEARISKLNGDYSIDSAPGRGTIIILDIPEI